MRRSHAIVAAAVAAGVLANYWLLEGALADRTDPSGSWISDLGARSEDTALRFDLLDSLSGLAILVLVGLLWAPLSRRSRELRIGLVALAGVGLCAVVDGAFPLSCAETLKPGCELSYDVVDVVHATENVLAAVTTIAAFWFLGTGLRAKPGSERIGAVTLALGALWLLLTALMASQFVVPGMDEVRGLFQRGSQVVLGAWLLALAFAAPRVSSG